MPGSSIANEVKIMHAEFMTFNRIILVVFLSSVVGCGKQVDRPKSVSSSVEPSQEKEAIEGAMSSVFSSAEIAIAKKVRRKETRNYGNLTQDSVIPVDACFVQEELRVPTTIGVVHLPYDSADTFTSVARKSAESVLSGTPVEPGCSRKEVGYWVRDDENSGDFVFRISAEAGSDAQLWWVPDTGESIPSDVRDLLPRVYIDRLLNVAGTRADADGDLQGSPRIGSQRTSFGPIE